METNIENKNEEKMNEKVFIAIIFITFLVMTVIGLSFATVKKFNKRGHVNTIRTSNISMNYTESMNGISITNALPISDAVGKALNGKGLYFDFTIKTTVANGAKVTYELAAEKDKSSTLSESDIKLYLERQSNGSYEPVLDPTVFTPLKEKSVIGSPVGSMVLKTVTKEKSDYDNYRLRMWIKEGAPVPESSKSFTIRVNVYGNAG